MRRARPVSSQVVEEGERLRSAATARAAARTARRRTSAARSQRPSQAPVAIAARMRSDRSATSLRLPSMCACTSVNVRPWPAQAQARAQPLHDVQRAQEFAHRIRRVAVVEEQRDAPQQVVAGDQQTPLGLEQADVRGRVAGRLIDRPRPEVGGDRHARSRAAVGLDHGGDAGVVILAPLGVAAQRLLGHAALARDLQPLGDRGARVLGPCVMCS